MRATNKVATLSLKVPDDLAAKFSVPGGVPAARMGADLMSFDLSRMSRSDKSKLREAIQLAAEKMAPVAARFPISSYSVGTTHGLGIESAEIAEARALLLQEITDHQLDSFIVPRSSEAPEMVVLASGTGISDPIDASSLPDPVSMSMIQMVLSEGSRTKVFNLGTTPDTTSMPIPGAAAPLTAGAVNGQGARFTIPVLVPEGVQTGDGRLFEPLSLTTRDLPIPLQWQIKSGDGHDGSVLVGRIDSIERIANGLGNAHGVFDTGPYGREAERLVRSQMLRGVSADLDQFEAAEMSEEDKKSGIITIKRGRVMAATLVTRPAFQECQITLNDEESGDNVTELAERTDPAITACAMIASSIPVSPPKSWFDNPSLQSPTPLTVSDDGHVFGHIALWHVSHLGLPGNTKPPRSRSNYAYFKTGVVRTEENIDIGVGQLTLAGGHADLAMSAHSAIKHYDETNSAVADVTAGEDAYGIWVAGALRPGVTPEQIRVLRASAPSGDWRPINGRLELVAVCQVNVPGFPVARARVASGYVTALVAAGASAVAQLKEEELRHINESPTQDLELTSHVLKARMAELISEGSEEALFRDYSDEKRADYALKGWALADGSFPIATTKDVKNAIRAYGRVKDEDKKRDVRKHVIKRARQLGVPNLVPESWNDSTMSAEVEAAIQRDRVQALVASTAAQETTLTASMSLSDGSYLVARKSDIPRTLHLLASESVDERKNLAERHIRSRAAQLGAIELLPQSWQELAIQEEADRQSLRVQALVASLRFRKPFVEGDHLRDEIGRFRRKLAKLHQDMVDTPGGEKAAESLARAEKEAQDGNFEEAARHADRAEGIVHRFEPGALNRDTALREGYGDQAGALAEVIGEGGNASDKYRFTDLPDTVQTLINSLLDEMENQVGVEEVGDSVSGLLSYMAGNDLATVAEIQSWVSQVMAHLLALRTSADAPNN